MSKGFKTKTKKRSQSQNQNCLESCWKKKKWKQKSCKTVKAQQTKMNESGCGCWKAGLEKGKGKRGRHQTKAKAACVRCPTKRSGRVVLCERQTHKKETQLFIFFVVFF